MLKEKKFQEYRQDYRKYIGIPKEQEKVEDEIEELNEQKEQEMEEAEDSFEMHKSELQLQYNQHKENSQNQAYIEQELLQRFPELNQQVLDLQKEIEEYNRKQSERLNERSKEYQRKNEELQSLREKTEAIKDSLQQELSNLQIPEVFDEEAFRRKRLYDLEHMPKDSMLLTDVDLSQKYKAEIEKEVASVMNQPLIQSVLSDQQQGLFSEKINDAMRKPFQPDRFNGVTRSGLGALVSKVEKAPQKPAYQERKQINREQITINFPIPKGITIAMEWVLPILVTVLAIVLLWKVNFNTLSYGILRILFIVAITAIGAGVGALFGKKTLPILIGGVVAFLISLSVSTKLANLMQGGLSFIIRVVLALAVFGCMKILASTSMARQIENNIARMLGKGKEEALREAEYQRLVAEQERVQQIYQQNLQKYENKMQQLETLEDYYYNLAHYKEIVTLVLEQERIHVEAKTKTEREAANRERVLARQKLEKDFAVETEELIQKYRIENTNIRKRIREEIALKKRMLKEKEAEWEAISSKDSQALVEYQKSVDSITEEANIKQKEITHREEEINARVLSCQQEIREEESERARQKEDQMIEAEKEHQRALQEIEQEYTARIAEKEEEIEKLGEMQKVLAKQMEQELDELGSNLVEYEESKGVLSDYLYPYDSNGKSSPKCVFEIKHCKKPIVFLYRRADSSAVAQSLYEFISMINMALLSINCEDIYDSIVSDPVAQATWFGKDEQDELIRINNNISSLYDEINNLRKDVGNTRERNIDDYNQSMAQKGEGVKRCLKYKVVQFLVPEQDAAANTDFFSTNLWGTLQASAENGFLPIFYINEDDWNVAMSDESHFNGKFVKLLVNSMGGEMRNVYIADAKKLSIEPYEKRSRR